MVNLFDFYEKNLDAKDFYSNLSLLVRKNPGRYNGKLLLPAKESSNIPDNDIKVSAGDIRIDMPVLMGNANAKTRILILGLEPRHTDDFYNVFKNKEKVFATPFGIDRWYAGVKQNIYASAFNNYLCEERLFLFSDFVKEYHVLDPKDKNVNSQQARTSFERLFKEKYQNILEEEIKLFKPNIIIGLGKTDIAKKIPKDFIEKYNIEVISHPINGNYPRMLKSMDGIVGRHIV